MPVLGVGGIVSTRDQKPYVVLSIDDAQAQLSVAKARNVAMDILQMCSRVEADAMIHRFFDKQEFPLGATVGIMKEFRDFRLSLDDETVERTYSDPDAKESD